MKVLAINQFGGPEQLRIQETAIPALKSGELLVRINAAGVNPVDFKIRNGSIKFITGSKFPMVPGIDFAGVVEQCPGSSNYRPGDKVFGMLSIKGGGYAEFVAVNEKNMCHIPENLSMTEAASVPLASLTALQAFAKGGGIKPGDRVLVNGASGGVGSFAVQIARAKGAYVTAVCSTRNTEFVRSLGADSITDYNAEDFTKSGILYDKVFDAVAKSSFSRCSRILNKGGIYVSTLPNTGLIVSIALNPFRSKKAGLIFTKPSGEDLILISDYIKKRQIKTYLQQTIPLEDGAKAHELIETERVRGKIVLSIID